MRSRTLIPLAAAAALALVPVASAATPDPDLIRMGRGMAGISLADTQAEVKAVLGHPAKTKTGSNDFGNYTELRYKGKLRVTFQGDENVSAISTAGDGQRDQAGHPRRLERDPAAPEDRRAEVRDGGRQALVHARQAAGRPPRDRLLHQGLHHPSPASPSPS